MKAEEIAAVKIDVGKGHCALIDPEDAPLVNQYPWQNYASRRTRYAFARTVKTGNKRVSMHRLIMAAKAGQIVDHVNGNGLDNRRSNLRFCNPRQNAWNRRARRETSSQFKGVWFDKKRLEWCSYIGTPNGQVRLGSH